MSANTKSNKSTVVIPFFWAFGSNGAHEEYLTGLGPDTIPFPYAERAYADHDAEIEAPFVLQGRIGGWNLERWIGVRVSVPQGTAKGRLEGLTLQSWKGWEKFGNLPAVRVEGYRVEGPGRIGPDAQSPEAALAAFLKMA